MKVSELKERIRKDDLEGWNKTKLDIPFQLGRLLFKFRVFIMKFFNNK